VADEWLHDYSRAEAAYPLPQLRDGKHWPPEKAFPLPF